MKSAPKTKTCTLCGKKKSIRCFDRQGSMILALRSQCKSCIVARNTARQARRKAPLYDLIVKTLAAHGSMTTGELAQKTGLKSTQIGSMMVVLRSARRVVGDSNPSIPKNRIWRLPTQPAPPRPVARRVRIIAPRAALTPPVIPPPMPPLQSGADPFSRELRKLKRESEARSAGIEDDDLKWMAYYRARAAQRQQQAAA